MRPDPWFPFDGAGRAPGGPAPDRTWLYCLPHAGGGASAYRTWDAALGPAVRAVPVQPPGREGRIAERPRGSAVPLAREAAEAIAARQERMGGAFALFGHSMGALLAYETARELLALGGPLPTRLIVSGCRAVHLPRPVEDVHLRDDPGLVDHLIGMGGTPPQVLESPALLDLILPVVRADYRLVETYRHRPGPLPSVPVDVHGGDADPHATRPELAAWSDLVPGPVRVRIHPGGHFYLHDSPAGLIADIAGALAGSRR